MAEIKVRVTDASASDVTVMIRKLREQLREMRPVMESLGALVASAGKKSFDDQALGSIEWKRRYPYEPFVVNVAGLVSDLAGPGGQPKLRRFQSRPANFDTGSLQASIEHEVVGNVAVDVGSPLEYAARAQDGGESTQDVTEDMRENLTEFFRTSSQATPAVKKRLGFLFHDDQLTTEVVPRPFLGIPDITASDMIETVEDFMVEAGS